MNARNQGQLTHEQSLDIIASMVQSTRTRLERNSGRPFLIWGYTVAAIAALNFVLRLGGANPNWSLSWFLIPVIGCALMWIFPRRSPTEPRTELDRIIARVWLVLALGIIPTFVIDIFSRTEVFGMITLLMASGVAITGLIVRSRIYTVAGFAGIVLSVVFAILDWWLKRYFHFTDDNRWVVLSPMLVYAVVFIVMMVVPGHIMNAKSRAQCSRN